MIDIKLSRIERTGKELDVLKKTYESEEEAIEIYNKLTDEYAEQTLPFFDEDEPLIRLDIMPQSDGDQGNKEQKECYFEYSDDLMDTLYKRI
ncbi:hypothetical protein GCM10022378_13180 [Salinicoccus jeotgali]|uniref:Uncharacterized protein n=1 Tax=Salinicoccus jeotgali TaxID=381634 RepID=A0ABP7ETD4_9STAP